MRTYLTALLLFLVFRVSAQYPVQVTPQLLPPYSLQISDYYSPSAGGASGKLSLMLLLRDFTRSNLRVRLRMSIESQSLSIRTREDVVLNTFLIEQPGVPLYITPSELAPYFNVANLQFSGLTREQYEQSGKLPEGFYTFCFEAVEEKTGQTVSAKACTMAWITLSEPPLLNLPRKAEGVIPSTPQYLTFQWTPRHTAAPMAGSIEYVFSLVELDSNAISPEAAFLSRLPLVQATTNLTTLVLGESAATPFGTEFTIGNSATQLIPDKRYAWRVQAKAKSGTEELAMFRHNGYSETYWFTYKNNCAPPIGISATPQGGRVSIEWQDNPVHLEYKVEYRQADVEGAEWFETGNTLPRVSISDLKPSTQYEYRVGGACEYGRFTFGNLQRFTTNAEGVSTVAQCGLVPDTSGTGSQSLLQSMQPGDTIRAGDFDVMVTNITGQNSLSGEGFVKVSWLADMKVGVRFTNIGVNTEKQLVSGVIETAYDPTEGGIADVDEYVDVFAAGYGVGSVVTGEVTADTTVNIAIQWPGGISVQLTADYNPETGTGRGPITITLQPQGSGIPVNYTVDKLPATLIDANGNIYQVNKDGQVMSLGAKGGETWLSKTNIKHIDADKAVVKFVDYKSDKVQYAFDEWKEVYKKSNAFNKEYERLNDNYYVSAKAIAPGKTDYIKAVVNVSDTSIKPENIQFVNGKGIIFNKTRIEVDSSGYRYEVAVVGGPENDAQEVYALYPQASGKTLNLGKVLVASYPRKEYNVVLIPVNGAAVNKDLIIKSLSQIYNGINLYWKVTQEDNLQTTSWEEDTPDGKLDVSGSDLFSNYSKEMKNLIRLYDSAYGVTKNTIFIFCLKEANQLLDTNLILGDMPRCSRFGFVFTYNNYADQIGKVVAHEIGHGYFNLKHIFNYPGFSIGNLEISNLMDYPNGSNLGKLQWDQIHDPAFVLGAFDNNNQKFDIYPITEDFGKSYPDLVAADNLTIPFLTPANEIIYLPKKLKNPVFRYGMFDFNNLNIYYSIPGVLTQFTSFDKSVNPVKETTYTAKFSSDVTGYIFKGYFSNDDSNKEYSDNIGGIFPYPNTSNMPYESNPKFVVMGLFTDKGWAYFKVDVNPSLPLYNKEALNNDKTVISVKSEDVVKPFSQGNNVSISSSSHYVASNTAIYGNGQFQLDTRLGQFLSKRNGDIGIVDQCGNQNSVSSYLPKIKLIELAKMYPAIMEQFSNLSLINGDYATAEETNWGTGTITMDESKLKFWDKFIYDNNSPNSRYKTVLNGTPKQKFDFYVEMIDSFVSYSTRVNVEKNQALYNLTLESSLRHFCDVINLFSDKELEAIGTSQRVYLLDVFAYIYDISNNIMDRFQSLEDNVPYRLIQHIRDADIPSFIRLFNDTKSSYEGYPLFKAYCWILDDKEDGRKYESEYFMVLSNLFRRIEKLPTTSMEGWGKLIRTIRSNGQFIFDNNTSFFGDDTNYEIGDNGKIKFGHQPNCYIGWDLVSDLEVNPFSLISVMFRYDMGIFKKDTYYQLTALELACLMKNYNIEKSEITKNVVINAAFAYFSLTSLGTALRAGSTSSSIFLSTMDFGAGMISLSNAIRARELQNTQAGRDYLDFWNKLLFAYGTTRAFTFISGAESSLMEGLEQSAAKVKVSKNTINSLTTEEKEWVDDIIFKIEKRDYTAIAYDAAGTVTSSIQRLKLSNIQSEMALWDDPTREAFWAAFNGASDETLLAIEANASSLLNAWKVTGNTNVAYLDNFISKYGDVGKYTTTIKWAALPPTPARPYGSKGYWGKRVKQSDARVEAYELKINLNNESFYIESLNGEGFLQFEGLNGNVLQDGKMVLQTDNPRYRVLDRAEFVQQQVLTDAIRQIEAASAKGLSVEWLVNDQVAVDQLTEFFLQKKVNISIKFLTE